jgi:stage V sporulation protein SpoVS
MSEDNSANDEESLGPKSESADMQRREKILPQKIHPSMLPISNQNGSSPDDRSVYIRKMAETAMVIMSKHGEVRLAAIGGGALEALHSVALRLRTIVLEKTGDEIAGVPYREDVEVEGKGKRKWRCVWKMVPYNI